MGLALANGGAHSRMGVGIAEWVLCSRMGVVISEWGDFASGFGSRKTSEKSAAVNRRLASPFGRPV
jgi:hypothetical protein